MKSRKRITAFFLIVALIAVCIPAYAANSSSVTWVRSSPGGGGLTFAPLINPYDSDNLVVCCDMGGVYITQNAGEDFSFRYLGSVMYADCFADENTLYIGGNALFKSIDKGDTFTRIFPKNVSDISYRGVMSQAFYENSEGYNAYEFIRAIAVSPDDSNALFVMSRSDYSGSATLYYSDDAGESFRVAGNFTLPTDGILKLFPVDGCSNEVYVAYANSIFKFNVDTYAYTELYYTNYGRILDAACYKGQFYIVKEILWNDPFSSHVVKLTSAGESIISYSMWQGMGSNKRNITTIDISDDGTLIAGFGSNWEYFGAASTTNDGASWEFYVETPWSADAFNLTNTGYLQDWQDNMHTGDGPLGLAMSKTDSSVFAYTTLCSVYMTTDGGDSFRQLESNYMTNVASYSTGLDVTAVASLSIDPNNPNNMLMGLHDLGNMRSTDGGKSWQEAEVNIPSDLGENSYGSVYIPEVPGLVFTIWARQHDIPTGSFDINALNSLPGGISVSYDGGYTHTLIGGGLPSTGQPVAIKYLYDKGTKSNSLYVCYYGKGVYRSRDLGKTWKQINKNLGYGLYAWDITTDNDNNLYTVLTNVQAPNGSGGVYKSTDGGDNWKEITLPAGATAPSSVAFDNSNTMYVGFYAATSNDYTYPYSWKGGGVYKTKTPGSKWQQVVSADSSVTALYYDKAQNKIFVSDYSHGVRYLKNDKLIEIPGFEFKRSNGVVISNGKMYVLSYGAGLWINE
jgi:photosystem II stability/assembly factor-like uncharacterized protein